ncbi:MAG: carboxypeptidase regulatory-like domain-containing protein, partial [Calditrichia bacterium]
NAPVGPQKLLITEIVVTPTGGEFVEIYNPTADSVNLSDYYISDATHQGSNIYYYQIVEGGGGGGSFSDFNARFPQNAMIAAGEYQTIAMSGDSAFFAEYNVLPTYELFEDSSSGPDVPDMREAVAGSVNGQGGLTNGDEVVILYYWDGNSDLVADVDYLLYNSGSPAANNEAVDKTGVSIDGPDAGTDSSTYLPDTPVANQVSAPSHDYGYSVHRIDMTEGAQVATGGNGVTGADETSEDLNNTFSNNSLPSPNMPYQPPMPPGVLLTEDFEGGSLPAGWTSFTNGVGWLIGDSAGLSSAYWEIPEHTIFAASNDDAPGSSNDGSQDYLVTPPLDFSNLAGVVVSFQSFYTGDYGELAFVEVSEDAGQSWNVVEQISPDTAWVQRTVDLSAYAGSDSVWIAFHADDDSTWASGWAIDDVVVREMETGTLAGTVTVNATGAGVDSALVSVDGMVTYTDANGAYSFPDIFVGMYNLTVMKEGYNTAMMDSVEIFADSTTTVDFALTAPTMDVSIAAIDTTVDGGDSLEVQFNISNNGDGELNYHLMTIPSTATRTDYSKYMNGGTISALKTVQPDAKRGSFKTGSSRDSVIIHYDGPYNDNGIGTNAASSWISAVRFTAEELAAYYGEYSLSAVQLHIRSADFTNVTLKVWQGGSFGDPGMEVYSQDITSAVLIDQWTEISLPTPIPLLSGQEYWIGYAIDATADHPSSVDDGPMVPGKGAWMFFQGVWAQLNEVSASLNYNWSIRGVLETGFDYWLSAYPVIGTIPANQSETITVKLDASMFNMDTTVVANMVVSSDPNVGEEIIPVSMHVVSTGMNDPEALPTVFALSQNFPNPFNPTTTIKYQLPQAVDVRLEIYNVLGQKVRTLVNNRMDVGRYEVTWDGQNDLGQKVGSGLYIYRIQAGDFVKTQKMILMK